MLNLQFQYKRSTFSLRGAAEATIFHFLFLILLTSCSVEKQIAKSAKTDVLDAKALQTAHVGISIFDPATNKYLYNYQGDKYFVPASNIKIPTCYAAMKYLGDSLVGLRYGFSRDSRNQETVLSLKSTGDPTLLHPDFSKHPVWEFLKNNAKEFKYTSAILDTTWQSDHLGNGWSWNDYEAAYMAERNSFPIYGNLVEIKVTPLKERRLFKDEEKLDYGFGNDILKTQSKFFDSLVNKGFNIFSEKNFLKEIPNFRVERALGSNDFQITETNTPFRALSIPFVTKGSKTTRDFIWKSLEMYIGVINGDPVNKEKNQFHTIGPFSHGNIVTLNGWQKIHSQPTDSLLKPMMHRSDNFFAEQSLLMVSNERLGVMNDEKIIDTLLKTDFKDLPQKPRWVDGSGLSRYNLFTPQDFVAILNKMKNEFGMDRIKVILPTGGEGTISNYYKADSGYIYAKTGTLSGVVAFSGFLYTKKGKLLIFSTLINNHQASATEVRKAIEKFLQGIRNHY